MRKTVVTICLGIVLSSAPAVAGVLETPTGGFGVKIDRPAPAPRPALGRP